MLQDAFGRVELSEVNDAARKDPAGLVRLCEDRYENFVEKLGEEILADPARHRIILLSGPSASGKTTSALKLQHYLNARGAVTHTISMDDFYKNRVDLPLNEDGSVDYETLRTLDLDLLHDCFESLAAGEKTRMPRFHFAAGVRQDNAYSLKLGSSGIVIMEGIHALNSAVYEKMPQDRVFKIYISARTNFWDGERLLLRKRNVRLTRRTVRDHQFRGADAEKTFSMWENVCKNEEKNIIPFSPMADAVFDTVFAYEPGMMRALALPLLYGLADHPAFGEKAAAVAAALEQFEPIDPDLVPTTSLLREFIGTLPRGGRI